MQLQPYEKEHIRKLRPYLSECCVLLRNNGDFPLSGPCEIALYGSGVRKTIKGGTGSGEVNSRYFNTVEKGFRKAGFTITTDAWLDAYDKVVEEAKVQFKKELNRKAKEMHTNVIMMCMGASMPAPEYKLPLDGAGETAIYVLSRESGEGSDREVKKGEIYLSDTEIRDILALQQKYARFLLVLNVGGVVDLSPLNQIENILILSQLGVQTGDALADIVLGKTNPSGRLTTTWAAWEQYPELIEFEGYDETRYREGIYVGYRYFDTMGVKPLFPFGYGLSFTEFAFGDAVVCNQKEQITVSVPVTNIGRFAGKEVVQLYVSVPGNKLDQPYQTLAGYAKTQNLKPGETETAAITFSMSEIASFNEEAAAYVLEEGSYILRLGKSSRNTTPVGVIVLTEDVITKQVKNCLGKPAFSDFVPDADREEIQETLPDNNHVLLTPLDFAPVTVSYEQKEEIDPFVSALSDDELLHLAMGHFNPKGGITGMIGNAGSQVPGTAGETAHAGGVKPWIMSDGPAGIRIAKDYFEDKKGLHSMAAPMPESMLEFAPAPLRFAISMITPKPGRKTTIRHQYCTAIPIGTAIAQSWNDAFAALCGDIVGKEMELFGIDLWLAPALNIHRSIRCGRNFEYYSEDPLISGKMAAAVTRGVQAHAKKGVTIKHFAANNQEFNRTSNNSAVSERAMREIYLKGFEICVREAAPVSVMSSYNLINEVHTAERRDLIEDILRCEFGFKGFVMTDWVINGGMIPKDAKFQSPHPAKVAAAGNDVFMPGSGKDFELLVKGYQEGLVTRKQLEINVSRMLHCMG